MPRQRERESISVKGAGENSFQDRMQNRIWTGVLSMKKEKAAAGTAAEENRSEQDYNPAEYFSQLKQGNFTCHEIAKAKFNGGQKKSRNNFMFVCPRCGKQKMGINEEINAEHGGVWSCLVCKVGGNRFELAAFILGLEYARDKDPVHFWIKNMMENHYEKVIQFRTAPRKKYSPEKPKYVTRIGKTLIQEPGLMILPSLVKALNLTKAAILQDIHFTCHYFKKERLCRSVEQWQAKIDFLHPDTVRKALKELVDEGLIEMQKDKSGVFWRVSYSSLEHRVLKALQAATDDTYSNTADARQKWI